MALVGLLESSGLPTGVYLRTPIFVTALHCLCQFKETIITKNVSAERSEQGTCLSHIFVSAYTYLSAIFRLSLGIISIFWLLMASKVSKGSFKYYEGTKGSSLLGEIFS